MINLQFLGFDKYAALECGNILSLRSGKHLKPITQKLGYKSIMLSQDGKRCVFLVHRLIAMSYIGRDVRSQVQVNHKDGIKANNAVDNLEWMSSKDNVRHAVQTGLKDSQFANAREVTDEQALGICHSLLSGNRPKKVAELFSTTVHVVNNIRHKKAYRHITDDFEIEFGRLTNKVLSEDVVIQIYKACLAKRSVKDITKEFEISAGILYQIRGKYNWKWLTDKIDLECSATTIPSGSTAK